VKLEFKHADLSVSFECDEEDHYDHVDLLYKIANLVKELSSHTGVSLIVLSNHNVLSSSETEDDEDHEDDEDDEDDG
jgi:hypothetical protein